MPEEFDIQKLLRLKRHEQPPPEYFEEFLKEFHLRQRAEILRQPLWRIVLERIHAFFGELALPRIAYASATAAVLVSASVASYNILYPSADPARIAALSPAARIADVAHQVATNQPPKAGNALAWNSQPLQTLQLLQLQADLSTFKAGQRSDAPAITPRYVIDTRPVSYEPPSSF